MTESLDQVLRALMDISQQPKIVSFISDRFHVNEDEARCLALVAGLLDNCFTDDTKMRLFIALFTELWEKKDLYQDSRFLGFLDMLRDKDPRKESDETLLRVFRANMARA